MLHIAIVTSKEIHPRLFTLSWEGYHQSANVEIFDHRPRASCLETRRWDLVLVLDCHARLSNDWHHAIMNMSLAHQYLDTR